MKDGMLVGANTFFILVDMAKHMVATLLSSSTPMKSSATPNAPPTHTGPMTRAQAKTSQLQVNLFLEPCRPCFTKNDILPIMTGPFYVLVMDSQGNYW